MTWESHEGSNQRSTLGLSVNLGADLTPGRLFKNGHGQGCHQLLTNVL